MNEASETKRLTDAVNTFVVAITEIIEQRVRTILDLGDQRIAEKLMEPALTKKQIARHFKISDIQAHWDALYRLAGHGLGCGPNKVRARI